MTLRLASAVEKMRPIRGHTLRGLKQDVTVRVYAPGGGSLEVDGQSFAFTSRGEALAMLDEYLRCALERAAAPAAGPANPRPEPAQPKIDEHLALPSQNGDAISGSVDREGGG